MAPKPEGFNLWGYLLPGSAILVAGGALVAFISRRRVAVADATAAARLPARLYPAPGAGPHSETPRRRRWSGSGARWPTSRTDVQARRWRPPWWACSRSCWCCGRSSGPRQLRRAVFEPVEPEETPKGVALLALKEIEFDRETGKLSDEDYQFLKDKYTAQALEALRAEEGRRRPTTSRP